MRKIIVPGMALGLLLFGATGGASASTAPWTTQPTPSPVGGDNGLAGVSCVSASDCIAVGNPPNHPDAVLGWNGMSWSQLPAPVGAGDLTSIACTSASYCIAVGQADSGLAGAWSWNGRGWTGQSAYNPKSTQNILNSISCASSRRCEAVGVHGNGGTTYPLAEVWNGTRWARQPTPGAPNGSLASVSCESASRCEAVGQNTYTLTVLAMRLSGSQWVTQHTPQLATRSHPAETGVSCWSSGCTAVGETSDTPSAYASLAFAESWNGRKWALQGPVGAGDPPNAGAAWTAVNCHSAISCVAVGAWANENVNETPATLVSTWNGRTWAQQPSPNPGHSTNLLNGIACTGGGAMCTAVGWAYPNPLAIGN